MPFLTGHNCGTQPTEGNATRLQMSKPFLDNNAKAKADFKARLDPDTSFELKISGWQLADSNYVEAETTLAITVSSEGVLSCGEPTCSAASRTFGTTPTTRSLFSAHKHAVAFHPPLRRALHVFARSGSAKQGMLNQPTIAKSSSSSSSSSMMGFSAISHEEHLAQMRRNHELSLARARERDALLERGREERLACAPADAIFRGGSVGRRLPCVG